MGFIMDGLGEEEYDRSYSDRALVRRITGYFRPQLPRMIGVAVLIVLNSAVDTTLPLLLSGGIDTLGRTREMSTAWLLVAAILVAGGLSWTFNFFRQWNTAQVVGDVVLKLRRDAFHAVLGHDMSFYDENSSGKIISRVTSDTDAFATVVTLTLNLLSQVLLVILIIGVLFSISPPLTLATLTIAPLIVLIALGFRRVAREWITRAQRVGGRVNATVQEAISGITVAKNFRQEATMYGEFRKVNAQAYQVNVRTGLVFSGVFPLLGVAAGIGSTLVVYFGGLQALDGHISPGTWFLFVQSINLFWFPLTGIASFWSQFQQGLSAGERIFALIDAEPRVRQTGARPVPRLRGGITFRDVDFRYVDDEPVLEGFNLTIQPGETVAFVGHTGAGKSTLGKLVARFYEFQGGSILIDGHDIREFDLRMYRRHLGVVPQTPFLFSGSVADNIRYARPGASDAAVAEVAAQIGDGEWLRALPDGLATAVGEGGRGLSLGQRQLVALARVLLQDPAIIILDEATASVDPLTEEQIQEGLDLVLAGRTAIIIAHRLSTIRHADRILVLRQGAIAEEGSHDALMRAGGHYAQLYNTYFRHQSPDYRPGEGFVPVRLPDAEAEAEAEEAVA
jgi:ATP-binding cassette, subfamily B, bacterial